jgi:HSP20 family protein
MTLVRRPSPFGELVSLRQAMDRLFDDSFVRPTWTGRGWTLGEGGSLALDVSRDADALHVEAALPGVKPDDVQITVENGTLTIAAESRDERTEKNDEGEVLVREIRRGSLSRSITLPTGLEPDKANATFENGVLRLDIPIAETVKPRQIRITPTTNGSSPTLETGDQPAAESATGQDA